MSGTTNYCKEIKEKRFDKILPFTNDIMESNDGTSSKGGNNMSNYVNKGTFEQFEKRIDDKLDSLPDRMADKMDAKISKFETRQTKWLVGIGLTLIGTFLKVFGII